ncbi:hypothetical protein H0H93_001964 [Arthromyces matolae]|nr:hypothetical protein H0H93_001964 [Arthromyces matolae]
MRRSTLLIDDDHNDDRPKLGKKERGGAAKNDLNEFENPDLLEPHILRSLANIRITSIHTSCNGCHFVAIDVDGAAWLFGRNSFGALGIPPGSQGGDEYVSENAPMKIDAATLGAKPGTRFVHAACGRNHTILVGNDGTAWSAGQNNLGQCGHGVCPEITSFKLITNIGNAADKERVVKASAGATFSLVLTDSGKIFSFGSAQTGQLGNGTTGERITTGNKTAFDIEVTPGSSGSPYSTFRFMQDIQGCKIMLARSGGVTHWVLTPDEDDSVMTVAWGQNAANGELGLGLDEPKSATKPTRVAPLNGIDIIDIAAGQNTTVFLSKPSDKMSDLPRHPLEVDPPALCVVCSTERGEDDSPLECDKCDSPYHLGCLNPPLTAVPDGEWFCVQCSRQPGAPIGSHLKRKSKPQAAGKHRDQFRIEYPHFGALIVTCVLVLEARSTSIPIFMERSNTYFMGLEPQDDFQLSSRILDDLDPTTGADIVEALLKRAHLFGVFELTIQEGKPAMTELNTREVLAPLFAAPGSFFELRELHFVDHSPPRRGSEFQQITVFQDSPHLYKVNLAMNFVEHPKVENFIAWYQLTDLTIGGRMSFPAFTYIFFECRRLQFAEFFFVDFRLDDGLNDRFIPTVPIIFPDLQSLSIRIGYINLTFGDVGFDQVLEKARLPKAHSLCLMNGFYEFRSYGHFAFPFGQLLALESNRYPLLRNIILSNADIDVQTLCQFLKLCSCLESLALHLPLPPIEILQALTERKEGADLSSLSSFLFAFEVDALHENTEVDLVSDAFGALIASWINHPQHRRPLQEFTLCMCDGKSLRRNTDPVCERVDKRLRQMVREKAGVKIRVNALVFFEDLMDILDSEKYGMMIEALG